MNRFFISVVVPQFVMISTSANGTVGKQDMAAEISQINGTETKPIPAQFYVSGEASNTTANCDGYVLFMRDIDTLFSGLDIIMYFGDFAPIIIQNFIGVWDFFVFYILGFAINYNDFQFVTSAAPYLGNKLSNLVTVAGLVAVAIDLILFHPLFRLSQLFYYVSTNYANLSLLLGLMTTFEQELFQMLGIRDALQSYLETYNDCHLIATKHLERQPRSKFKFLE